MTHFKLYAMMLQFKIGANLRNSMIKRYFCQEASEAQMKYMVRCQVQLDPSLQEMEYKVKFHPGRRNTTPVELPERLVKAAFKISKSVGRKNSDLMSDAVSFRNHISRRQLPPSDEDIRNKAKEVLERIIEKDGIDPAELSPEAKESLEQNRKDKLLHKLKTKVYNWNPIDYNEQNCVLHLLGCFPSNYATLCKIFLEIKKSAPTFTPKTFLDFGSGTGSGIWAINECFGAGVSEVLCIDASGEMNQLNQLLLQDGDPEGDTWVKNLFFRRHLPPSNLIKYDLVISAHTLSDLPTSRERIQVVNNLWNKTQDVLVIVEHGSFAGHTIVIEARDYILDKAKNDPLKQPVYVVAPCQNDFPCPKSLSSSKRPCSFPVKYHTMSFHKKQDPQMEKYSYIVFSKKKYKEESKWPRLISPVMKRSNHVICRMCNTDGKLYESIVTRSNCGKDEYKIARYSKWGDLLPVSLINKESAAASSDEHFSEADSSGEDDSDSEESVDKGSV